MTREGDETGEDTNEPVDNVIAFPGARVRPAPTEEAPPQPTPTVVAEDRPAEEPGMTLDAFERAVRSAVREKLGDSPERPQGADELVAQVFSALTGKDAKTALSEVRQRLAEPATVDDEGNDGDVIDLSAVREARQRASLESAQKIGGAIKDSFSQFLATLAQRQGLGQGSGEITLDASFFKQHGSALLGNLFQGLAATLMQQQKPAAPAAPTPPTPPAEPVAEGSEPKPDEPKPVEPRQVQVKLDLGSILSGLFRRRDTPETPKD